MSSSITTSSTITLSTVISASPSASQSPTASSPDNPGGFYKNLFYILIGLLVAFGLVSFLSLMRARRRSRHIIREAERLGVMVPGVPGYIPMRERNHMTWAKSDGTESPDWWEVQGKEQPENPIDAPPSLDLLHDTTGDFQPLAVIPPPVNALPPPLPRSELSFFPNHLAYRPSSLLPPPSRYQASDLASMDGLDGESVDIITIIRMPGQTWSQDGQVEEREQSLKDWNGVELGIVSLQVGSM